MIRRTGAGSMSVMKKILPRSGPAPMIAAHGRDSQGMNIDRERRPGEGSMNIMKKISSIC